MKQKKAQQKVGRPSKLRGQQTGFAGTPDRDRQQKKSTPAILGRRRRANKMAADASAQHIGSDSVTPRTTSPSTPAMTTGGHKGESGGETGFKARLQGKRSRKART